MNKALPRGKMGRSLDTTDLFRGKGGVKSVTRKKRRAKRAKTFPPKHRGNISEYVHCAHNQTGFTRALTSPEIFPNG